ncbi:MAG: hypothetical protein QM759_15700 [Terricaulis sp.]
MFDSLLRDLGEDVVRGLEEQTVARAVGGGKRASEISVDPPERLIGHNRQEYVRSSFHEVMRKHGFHITPYSSNPGAPSVHFVAGDHCNFTHLSWRVGQPLTRRNRTLAAICSETLPAGAWMADLFGELRALQPPKPVIAWLAQWRRARSDDADLPLWSGFVRLRAQDERTIIIEGGGMSYGDALLRAQQIAAGAREVPADQPLVRLRRHRHAA